MVQSPTPCATDHPSAQRQTVSPLPRDAEDDDDPALAQSTPTIQPQSSISPIRGSPVSSPAHSDSTHPAISHNPSLLPENLTSQAHIRLFVPHSLSYHSASPHRDRLVLPTPLSRLSLPFVLALPLAPFAIQTFPATTPINPITSCNPHSPSTSTLGPNRTFAYLFPILVSSPPPPSRPPPPRVPSCPNSAVFRAFRSLSRFSWSTPAPLVAAFVPFQIRCCAPPIGTPPPLFALARTLAPFRALRGPSPRPWWPYPFHSKFIVVSLSSSPVIPSAVEGSRPPSPLRGPQANLPPVKRGGLEGGYL
jgi:hypothetical protein